MPISWNEIRQNAIRFARDWAGASSESAEKQTFWNEFFAVFGVSRRTVASFEKPVRNLAATTTTSTCSGRGCCWSSTRAAARTWARPSRRPSATSAILPAQGRQDEVPRYVIVSDFARISLLDLEPEDPEKRAVRGGYRIEFPLAELHRHIHDFAFIPGYQQHRFEDQDPINLRAVKIMDDLHDTLEAGGYSGHELERFLVRVLFCLFAESTGIFEPEAFRSYIEDRTKPDGSDLGLHLARLFDVLNTPRRSARRTWTKRWPRFPTSTASCSRRSSALPTSTATCATACWPARGSTGRAFRRPFSARCFRA